MRTGNPALQLLRRWNPALGLRIPIARVRFSPGLCSTSGSGAGPPKAGCTVRVRVGRLWCAGRLAVGGALQKLLARFDSEAYLLVSACLQWRCRPWRPGMVPHRRALLQSSSSAGRAPARHAGGRGFEAHFDYYAGLAQRQTRMAYIHHIGGFESLTPY